MSWVSNFLTSSIGKKLIMSLTGIFLILFLTVHLIGNLQLLVDDQGKTFNLYAKMMTTNPLIKVISIGNYIFILLHAILGIAIWRKNSAAKGSKYAVKNVKATGTSAVASSNMAWFGIIISIFLILHLYQFWMQMHFGDLPLANYDGEQAKNLFIPVQATFENPFFVGIYVVSMAVIGMHLWHGFQSAFQTLGLNHKKYTPFIKGLGKAYSILIPLGFAIIPILYFLNIKF